LAELGQKLETVVRSQWLSTSISRREFTWQNIGHYFSGFCFCAVNKEKSQATFHIIFFFSLRRLNESLVCANDFIIDMLPLVGLPCHFCFQEISIKVVNIGHL